MLQAPSLLQPRRVQHRTNQSEPSGKIGGPRSRSTAVRRGVLCSKAEPGWRPGWDFVGVTQTAAADGSGHRPGTRVVASCRRAPGPNGSIAARMRSPCCPMRSGMPRRRLCRSRASLHCMRYGRAGCCSGARCWSTAPQAGSGISPANSPQQLVHKSGAMCAGRDTAPPWLNGVAIGSCSAANLPPRSRTGPSG